MPTRIDPLFRQLIKKPRTKNERKPRICEHEEKQIAKIIVPYNMIPGMPYVHQYWFDDDLRAITKAITRYLNTKKPCAKCSKKK